MTLPAFVTQHATVDVDGEEIKIRSLSRGETAQLQNMVKKGADLADLEVFLIPAATDTPKDEAKSWYETAPNGVVPPLIEAIRVLSRLDEEAQKSG